MTAAAGGTGVVGRMADASVTGVATVATVAGVVGGAAMVDVSPAGLRAGLGRVEGSRLPASLGMGVGVPTCGADTGPAGTAPRGLAATTDGAEDVAATADSNGAGGIPAIDATTGVAAGAVLCVSNAASGTALVDGGRGASGGAGRAAAVEGDVEAVLARARN